MASIHRIIDLLVDVADPAVFNDFRNNPGLSDKELIKKSGLSRGTFYKYKNILKRKGLI